MMIRVLPDMDVWSRHSPDHIRLQRLDWSNIRVIAAVLGQSVALDFYARSIQDPYFWGIAASALSKKK